MGVLKMKKRIISVLSLAALIITVYTALVARLVKALTDDSGIVSDLMAVCFLLFHFLMYKNEFTGNVHLLWAHDVTCLFHYTFCSLRNNQGGAESHREAGH